MVRIGTRLSVRARLTSALLAVALTASAYGFDAARTEKDLFAAINRARREQGLRVLRWDESLARAARQHAELMAEHRETQHEFPGELNLSARIKQAGLRFTWLAENVTQGPNAELIHSQFMNSPKHRANIVDMDMNSAGIGVVERDGRLFAVEDFAQTR